MFYFEAKFTTPKGLVLFIKVETERDDPEEAKVKALDMIREREANPQDFIYRYCWRISPQKEARRGE